ncbi:hypothetical protein OUZ56_017182 [Daphnia magna]|uniref:Uncharacterized protein n=1 Tax=Daphnia magna TaxID=35525 RepID=A0ABR0ASE5_9CRUS|nr:hypothetical protein OUZ56_017182 [Daphnia magna]
MAQSTFPLPVIFEDDEPPDWETTIDPVRLKRFRTTGKSIHTKSGKRLMTAVQAGDDRDTLRALRATYVCDYDDLERRHDRFLQFSPANLSPEAINGEQNWLQIQEAERFQKQAKFKLQKAQDEAARRTAEDAALRQAEDYQRQVAADRRQRELQDQIHLQRLSGAILKQQLNQLTGNEQDPSERALSTGSAPVPIFTPSPASITTSGNPISVTANQPIMDKVAQSSSIAPNPPLNPFPLTSTRMSSTPQVVLQQMFANPQLVPPPTFTSRFPSPPSFFHGPAMPATAAAPSAFIPTHNYGTPQPTSVPFPSSIMAPPVYLPRSPSPTAPPHASSFMRIHTRCLDPYAWKPKHNYESFRCQTTTYEGAKF